MLREEANLLEGYKELETNKGGAFETAKTLEDGGRILVSKRLFKNLSSDLDIAFAKDTDNPNILVWKTSKTIYFVLDVDDILRGKHFAPMPH